jgi:glycosyltransferase involved in cell wall biosynthesis
MKVPTIPPRRVGRGPEISIVVPLWNEEKIVEPLIAKLRELDAALGVPLEVVIVNDGSSDRTRAALEALLPGFAHWQLLNLSRNFGQQAAFRAGIEAATGQAVVMMDGDLQDPPEFIPEMVAAWRNGAKVVTGCRRSRPERGLRGFCFRRFHDLFHFLTGGVMPKDSGTFGLMDRLVVDQLKQMPELNVFLPALRCWVGYKQAKVWYDRKERDGEAKQSFARLFNYAWDGITSFSDLPLKLIAVMGFAISFLGFAYGAVLVALRVLQLFGFLSHLSVLGFTTVAVAVFFIGGIQLICIGILGEYLARIYKEVKKRPTYILDETSGSDLSRSSALIGGTGELSVQVAARR